MEVPTIRPLVSGLAGAVVTYLLMRGWAKSLPQTYASKSIEQISHEQRTAVSVGNALFFVGLFIGLAMYEFGGYDRHDWTPLAIGFGFASLGPVFAIPVVAKMQGLDMREAFVAFSVGQGVPTWATYGTLALGAFSAIVGVFRIVT